MERILVITDAWHPQVNGVTRGVDARMREFQRRGIEMLLIEPSQFRTVRLPVSIDIRLALFVRRRVRTTVESGQFDAVHIETEGPLGWAARRECLRLGIPFTTWYHTRFDAYLGVYGKILMPPITSLLRRFHAGAARVMVSTPTLKEMLERDGFRNVVVVPLGVDTNLFVRNLAPKLPSLEKPVFCYFSRLAPEKTPEEFFALDLPGTKLVIGDGPLRKRLEKKYGDTHLFVGYKRGQELVDYLSLADVLIFPSRTETFGLVVIEALATGVPVAAHDAMGPRDIITPGIDGYVSEDLRDAALRCLTLSREACREKALQYSWEHSVDTFLANLVPANPAV